VRTLDGDEYLFKFFDEGIREEKEVKKIKDDMIYAKAGATQKVIKFAKQSKGGPLEVDTAVFVSDPHNQYGVIRKTLKG